MTELKKAYKNRDQYDNVYAEAKPAHYFPMRDCKLITVKVQTNLLELLGVDDLMLQDARARQHGYGSAEEEYVEEYVDGDYTRGLINNVIDGLADADFKKRRRRLPKNRLKEIPNFELADITGDFEIDDEGNNLIVKGADGKLNDREGRRVNRRGYLVDVEGNIITRKGTVIFRIDEVDEDDEIPAPFCFEKKKEHLFKIEGMAAYNSKYKKEQVEDEEDEIEREFNRLKKKNASNRSSVDSLMGETPSKYNRKNKRKFDDDDSFLSKIV